MHDSRHILSKQVDVAADTDAGFNPTTHKVRSWIHPDLGPFNILNIESL